MKVSVIIPVYNAENYLEKCLNSILEQKLRELEVILIDDASTDRSGVMCDKYAQKHTFVTAHHVNRAGAGSARNTGLQLAKGEYIVFADADDFLHGDSTISRMADLLDQTGADIAVGNYKRLWDGVLLDATKHDVYSKEDREQKNFRYAGFFSVGNLSYVWGKMYRRSFLEKHQIRFGSYDYAEDKMFNFVCYIERAKYVFLDDVTYVYRKNSASISNQYRANSVGCWMKIATDTQNYLEKTGKEAVYADLVAFSINFAAFFDGKMQYRNAGNQSKEVKELLNEYGKFPLANRYFCEMAKGKYLNGVKSAGWKLMMWGFSLLMHMRAYSLLAFGIKCLIDFRIDEILSDTGLKRQKNK